MEDSEQLQPSEHLHTINRERAVEFLYKIDILNYDVDRCKSELKAWPKNYSYANRIVGYYLNNSEKINSEIENILIDWKITRLSYVDRAILRWAVSEMIIGFVPKAVVLQEAINLADLYSSVDSKGFINGVLAHFVPQNTMDADDFKSDNVKK